jgi:hypothetical protein
MADGEKQPCLGDLEEARLVSLQLRPQDCPQIMLPLEETFPLEINTSVTSKSAQPVCPLPTLKHRNKQDSCPLGPGPPSPQTVLIT